MFKAIKWSIIGTAGAFLIGALIFGTDIISYATSSFKMFKGRVKSAVPMEFEIQRARDLLSDIIPELQANVVVVAKEEVEVESLEKEIAKQKKNISVNRKRIKCVRNQLDLSPVNFSGNSNLSKDEAIKQLACRVESMKLAERLLQGKERVLEARKQSLSSAIQSLKEVQLRKVKLEAQIEDIEHQIRLVKLQQNAPEVNVDQSSLVKAEKLVSNLKKRLDIAQKVISAGSTYMIPIEEEQTNKDLLSTIDKYLDNKKKSDQNIVSSKL